MNIRKTYVQYDLEPYIKSIVECHYKAVWWTLKGYLFYQQLSDTAFQTMADSYVLHGGVSLNKEI